MVGCIYVHAGAELMSWLEEFDCIARSPADRICQSHQRNPVGGMIEHPGGLSFDRNGALNTVRLIAKMMTRALDKSLWVGTRASLRSSDAASYCANDPRS
jgi:hypothetical protein